MARKRSSIRLCLAIKAFSGRLCGHVQSGAAGKANCVFSAKVLCHLFFDLVYNLANCTYPVGLYGFVYPPLLLAVHRGGGEPYFLLEWLHTRESQISRKFYAIRSLRTVSCYAVVFIRAFVIGLRRSLFMRPSNRSPSTALWKHHFFPVIRDCNTWREYFPICFCYCLKPG